MANLNVIINVKSNKDYLVYLCDIIKVKCSVVMSPLPADWSRVMGSTSSGGVDALVEFLLIVLWRMTHTCNTFNICSVETLRPWRQLKGSYDIAKKNIILCIWCNEKIKFPHTVHYCWSSMLWRDETKTIKPIINEAFVASSGDIITDYNDLYCLFTSRVASRRVNITMSAFVIGETTNNKRYSTLLRTRVSIVSSRIVLTGCESEEPDCPWKVGIAPLYRNSLCAASIVGYTVKRLL